jgi:hypothetical protein
MDAGVFCLPELSSSTHIAQKKRKNSDKEENEMGGKHSHIFVPNSNTQPMLRYKKITSRDCR